MREHASNDREIDPVPKSIYNYVNEEEYPNNPFICGGSMAELQGNHYSSVQMVNEQCVC